MCFSVWLSDLARQWKDWGSRQCTVQTERAAVFCGSPPRGWCHPSHHPPACQAGRLVTCLLARTHAHTAYRAEPGQAALPFLIFLRCGLQSELLLIECRAVPATVIMRPWVWGLWVLLLHRLQAEDTASPCYPPNDGHCHSHCCYPQGGVGWRGGWGRCHQEEGDIGRRGGRQTGETNHYLAGTGRVRQDWRSNLTCGYRQEITPSTSTWLQWQFSTQFSTRSFTQDLPQSLHSRFRWKTFKKVTQSSRLSDWWKWGFRERHTPTLVNQSHTDK